MGKECITYQCSLSEEMAVMVSTENGDHVVNNLHQIVIVHILSTDVRAGGVRGGDPARRVVSRAGTASPSTTSTVGCELRPL